MAISYNKIIQYEIHKTNINRNIFIKFIQLIVNNIKNHYFLMDNVSFHKGKELKQIIENSSNKLIFIPPYSPQFNPIENVFSQMKRNLDNLNPKNFLIKLKKSLNFIKRKHLQNYYYNSFVKT